MTLRVVSANLLVRLKSFRREKSAVFFAIAFPVILVQNSDYAMVGPTAQ